MDAIPLCLFWKGFTVAHHELLDPQTLRLQLEPDDRIPPVCSGCDHACFLVHDVHRRRVREAPLLIYRVEHDVPVRRLRCPVCGPTRERIDWLPGRSPVTTTLRQWVERLVTLLPIRHVADLVGLHWHTVKTIDKRRLQRNLPAPDPKRLRRLMMDEFALHKGHRYATVIACADTQQVVWIGEGRSREAIDRLLVAASRADNAVRTAPRGDTARREQYYLQLGDVSGSAWRSFSGIGLANR